jgi:multidrug efflux pump
MNISEPFLHRPIGTTLLTVAVALAGGIAFNFLPVSPLPQVDFPTISISTSLPGASPLTMASSVATPLERQFGRIAGITEMTSSSALGSTSITIQFDLDRNIDAAARDVQAAINAARSNLPANLPGNPSYRKVNPSDSPILIIALTSKIHSRGQMYDAASTILSQKISQIDGIGQVVAGGSSLPAVRVEANPTALNKYGIGFPALANVLAQANANLPKGQVSNGVRSWTIEANDQIFHAADYRPLIVSYQNGAPVRVSDVAQVTDDVEDIRNAGYSNSFPSTELKPSALLILFRQPNANIIDTVDRVRAILPQLKADLPGGIDLTVVMDRTETIRASVHDVEVTLVISVLLVIGVVFLFLRNVRATLIPAVVVPVSLIGTFGAMYLLGYSLDNLSLMALTISTGFVVDDAIVVLENISRHIEKGLDPMAAARLGAREIGFTVLSMSVSLCAVFIPLLLMGGIVGRLFREFAITLTVAILVSLVLSLTTTPMMCAYMLRHQRREAHGRFYRFTENLFERMIALYDRALVVVLRHPAATLIVVALTVALNVFLFIQVPKGFFPQQDTGRLQGSIQADQASSFQAMDPKLSQMMKIVMADPAVANVTGFTGGSILNTARVFISLKPLGVRKIDADHVIARLRPKLAHVPGATLYMQSAQDLRVGGRVGNALYQYTLQADTFDDLFTWAPKLLKEMQKLPELVDVNTDQQDKGRQTVIEYDRNTASRFGISAKQLDQTLYDAFGQSQASVMYTNLNQYHVVLEAAPQYWQNPESLDDIWIQPASGGPVPLSAVAHYASSTAPLSVNHQGQFPAVTLSFNLVPGVSLGQAVTAIDDLQRRIMMPATVRGTFAGTAQAYQAALANEPLLIAAALATVYIILGILYESYIHPITILSTLPSAGVGAVLALMITHTDLSIIAIIGVILLIGIVKKNAIMMIDFALVAEREEGKSPRDAIHEACLLRFRPIMMTTMAALLGAVPLALGSGTGSELRRPLGITIIGGLVVSQALTLFTTPVIYLAMENLRRFTYRLLHRLGLRKRNDIPGTPPLAPVPAAEPILPRP